MVNYTGINPIRTSVRKYPVLEHENQLICQLFFPNAMPWSAPATSLWISSYTPLVRQCQIFLHNSDSQRKNDEKQIISNS